MEAPRPSRRQFLERGLGFVAGLAVAAPTIGRVGSFAGSPQTARSKLRRPGSLPHPRMPAGTDTIPQIDHIIVVMMENHSYDNYLGMLGRGDGLRLDKHHQPLASNPDTEGNVVHAFRMPTTCQLRRRPSTAWNASHISFNGGHNDGFVRASGEVAMGYWTAEDLPFYYSLARNFVLCDRWFGSCLAQTYPNRRFLLAATSNGLVTNGPPGSPAILAPSPAGGLIFDQLDAHSISWKDYASDLPTAGLFQSPLADSSKHLASIDAYLADAASGNLPAFALIDPPATKPGSEENPQNIQVGEEFVSRVIQAAMSGPAWKKTLLIWCYDEHGGYYDHVPPPRAVKPDNVAPDIHLPADQPGAFDRYGFRVPAVIVSPYARRGYVSHVTHDHTSILKLVETKWNLPALTYRDANADDLLDSLDLHHQPRFLEPPKLAAPAMVTNPATCKSGEAGTIPPPGAVTAKKTPNPTRT
ncbi:MAG: alkaline phosphatase family protein [Actinobacteria bacterium]|nr:MAG: alkaline phosphatase family protein [Actinomycetota bacterium]